MEEIVFPCEAAKKYEDDKPGQTLLLMTRKQIANDTELQRRVRVLTKWARPASGCEIAWPPNIIKACQEGVDPETHTTDRKDYEWHARVAWNCPKEGEVATDILQSGG